MSKFSVVTLILSISIMITLAYYIYYEYLHKKRCGRSVSIHEIKPESKSEIYVLGGREHAKKQVRGMVVQQ